MWLILRFKTVLGIICYIWRVWGIKIVSIKSALISKIATFSPIMLVFGDYLRKNYKIIMSSVAHFKIQNSFRLNLRLVWEKSFPGKSQLLCEIVRFFLSIYRKILQNSQKNVILALCGSFQLLHSEMVIFWLKREVFSQFPRKYFIKQEKISLAVCGSIWWGKTFFVIFVPFHWFNQKSCFIQTKFSSGFSPFQTCWEKIISENFWASFWEFHVFDPKREFFSQFLRKCFKTRKSLV